MKAFGGLKKGTKKKLSDLSGSELVLMYQSGYTKFVLIMQLQTEALVFPTTQQVR